MAESGEESPYKGQFGIIRRIDDWIFAIEMGILWTFLGVSAVMVFLDVMYRRLAAPDSKVAELAARILGVESPEGLETLTTMGPIVTPNTAMSAMTSSNATMQGTAFCYNQAIGGEQITAINNDNKNGTSILSAAFMPATTTINAAVTKRKRATGEAAMPLLISGFLRVMVYRLGFRARCKKTATKAAR